MLAQACLVRVSTLDVMPFNTITLGICLSMTLRGLLRRLGDTGCGVAWFTSKSAYVDACCCSLRCCYMLTCSDVLLLLLWLHYISLCISTEYIWVIPKTLVEYLVYITICIVLVAAFVELENIIDLHELHAWNDITILLWVKCFVFRSLSTNYLYNLIIGNFHFLFTCCWLGQREESLKLTTTYTITRHILSVQEWDT